MALENTHGPTVLALSRQGCTNFAGSSVEGVSKGAYVIQEASGTKEFMSVILVATGSEVQLCGKAATALNAKGVNCRVVSMPCTSAYDAQTVEYKESIFPTGVPVLSVEALCVTGWEKYAHAHVGMTTFGASGKGPELMTHFGFSEANLVEKCEKMIAHYKGAAPTLQRPSF